MRLPSSVIASTRIGASRRPGTGSAKQSPATARLAEIASSGCALLAMTAFVLLIATPARADDVEQGREVYHELCAACHGRDLVAGGGITFDLRQFPKDDFARFKTSVLNGKGRAMPAWADKVNEEDVANLWAYVKSGG